MSKCDKNKNAIHAHLLGLRQCLCLCLRCLDKVCQVMTLCALAVSVSVDQPSAVSKQSESSNRHK